MQALVIIEASGKVGTWSKVLQGIGMKADVLATHGHIQSFPGQLWPIGISFDGTGPCDRARKIDAAKSARILEAVRALPVAAPIFIASDDDVEGDVIALDLVEFLMSREKGIIDRIFRARPRALNSEAIIAALDTAKPLRGTAASLIEQAIPGRARAISDRWIGAVYSRALNHPVGRVRSGLLGAFYLLDRAPQLLRSIPDLGEVTLRCRSGTGGIPFIAHVPLNGKEPAAWRAALIAMAEKFKGRQVPGVVRQRVSLSAAVAPRIGTVRPFNTGDALAYAARHFNLSAAQAMTGLQDAYMAGLTSYPRTESRQIGRESAVRVVRIAEACRISGVDVNILHGEAGPSLAEAPQVANNQRQPHEALHPICDLDRASITSFEEVLRAPIPFRDRSSLSREAIRDIMVAMVARRAIEAAREVELELGDWRPDNSMAATPEEVEILDNLEWVRECGAPLPWSKDLMTGVRKWPVRAVAIDMMMAEGIGKPSTYAHHADTAEASGEIEDFEIGKPPRPSPFGRKIIARLPKGLWNPGTCRMIETILANQGDVCQEDVTATMQSRMVNRVKTWFVHLPDEMQHELMKAIDEGSGSRDTAISVSIQDPEAEISNPCEVSTDLGAPTPFLS